MTAGRPTPLRALAVLLMLAWALCPSALPGARPAGDDPQNAREMWVHAAVSFSPAARRAAAILEAGDPGLKVHVNAGASAVLMRQIEAGAPADVFISASPDEVARLDRLGLLVRGTITALAANELVVVTGAGVRPPDRFEALPAVVERCLAVGNPSTVPAGRYARQALRTLGLWESVSATIVPAENAWQVLAYVSRGECEAGLAYRSDAARRRGDVVVGPSPPRGTHQAIVITGAVVRDGAHPRDAEAFLAFFRTPEGRRVLEEAGLLPPPAP